MDVNLEITRCNQITPDVETAYTITFKYELLAISSNVQAIQDDDRFKTPVIIYTLETIYQIANARGVMVIVVGNGHGDTSSNPWHDWLHFT